MELYFNQLYEILGKTEIVTGRRGARVHVDGNLLPSQFSL